MVRKKFSFDGRKEKRRGEADGRRGGKGRASGGRTRGYLFFLRKKKDLSFQKLGPF